MTNQAESTLATVERRTVNLWPEFGRIIGLGKEAVYQGAKRRDFKTIRIGRRILVPKSEVDRLLSGAEDAPLPDVRRLMT